MFTVSCFLTPSTRTDETWLGPLGIFANWAEIFTASLGSLR